LTTYFEITGGMPVPLAVGATEMYFSQDGNGGRVGFAHVSANRNIVMIDNVTVANLFRAHLQRSRARFTEVRQAPQGVHFDILNVPTRAEVQAMMDDAMKRLHAEIMRAIFSPRPRRFRRRGRK
jgi:hypothetical protein